MESKDKEAAPQRSMTRVHGEVVLLPRVSHVTILGFVVCWFALVTLWLIGFDVARKETVSGWLDPPEGVVRIFEKHAGYIARILVRDGERIVAEQPLIVVKGNNYPVDGKLVEATLLAESRNQQNLIRDQIARLTETYQNRTKDLRQRIAAASANIQLLESQLLLHAESLALSQSQINRLEALHRQGLIAKGDVDAATAQTLQQRIGVRTLERELVNLKNSAQQMITEQLILGQDRATDEDRLKERLSEVSQRVAELESQSEYVIRAPRAGVVNNLQARVGQQLTGQGVMPLLSIFPSDSELTVQLLAPVTAVAFVKPGQRVTIRYDAFPYQKFGVFSGEVVSVSSTVLLPNELQNAPVSIQAPVYRVEARTRPQSGTESQQEVPLKSGMTLSADITLEERTLLQWLLEPLYSLRGRI